LEVAATGHTPKWSLAALMAVIALTVGLARRVAAQGCAACYESAAASGAQGRAALRHGILILLVPTLSLLGLIIGLVYKRRNLSR
jgi:hypothetical protein